MKKINIKAVWSLEDKVFKLTCSLPDKETTWDLSSDNFLKMIEDAEDQLIVQDGQNKSKTSFNFEFVDKHAKSGGINLVAPPLTAFKEFTAYFRKVYESWSEYESRRTDA